jgi:Ca2+-binding EF-hand superfamily protein
MMKRQAKKTEILQVRVPHGLKRDFMDRCRLENRVASDVVRAFLESYLLLPVEMFNSEKAIMMRRRFVHPSLAAAGLLGAVVTFLPVAGQAQSLEQEFSAADKDRDGQLLADEWGEALQSPGAPLIVLTRRAMTFSRDPTTPPADEPMATTRKLLASDFGRNLVQESDLNGDAKVNLLEYRSLRVRMAQELFLRADKNNDGRMTKAEFLEATIPARAIGNGSPEQLAKMRGVTEAKFDAIDKGHSGFLTREAFVPS